MNATRLAAIITVVVKHGGGYLLDRLGARFNAVGRYRANPTPAPERLRQVFEELGGCYIKFGQMLALQPDILSIEYCNALFNLLDRVHPFGFETVERTFVEEFGHKPQELFDRIEREPLATASIGQVHIAWLSGRKLAVKVQRPSVQKDFAGDIRLMTAAVWAIRALRLRPFSWMIEPMSEFIAWTREELDYRYEARYLKQLRQNARTNPHEFVPEVLDALTSRRTLAMDFLEGCTVLGYLRALESGDTAVFERLERGGFDSHAVAAHIIDNFLGDVFQHGLFHADLHPANLMILPGNRVGYMDFGITGTISCYSRQNLVALTLAYTRGDLEAMREAFFRVSAIDSRSNPAGFQAGLARDARQWYQSNGKELHLKKNFTLVMLDMLRLSRQTGIWPERDVIKYIRSAIAIDGLITRFAPTFDLGAYLETVCGQYLQWHSRSRLFTFDQMLRSFAPAMRLFRDGALRASGTLARFGTAKSHASHVQTNRGDSVAVLRRRVLGLAIFTLIACMALSTSPAEVRLGLNLFTSEAALAALGLAALGSALHKLTMGGRQECAI